MGYSGGEVGDDGCKPGSDVGEVVGVDGFVEELLDHRLNVMERSDWWERVARSEHPARNGEKQGCRDSVERDAAIVE